MQINTDSNIKYIIKSKSEPAIFTHLYTKAYNAGLAQHISVTAEIRQDNNALIVSALPVSITQLREIIPSLITPDSKLIAADLSIDISSHTDLLSDTFNYYVVFIIAYSEDSTLVETTKIAYGFQVITNSTNIAITAKSSDTITTDIINNKFAGIVSPGILFGLSIQKGSGPDMFDLHPGEAMAANGQKLIVSAINYNVIKSYPVPNTGSRVDAICIDNNAKLINIAGPLNGGVPVVDEADKTVIGFLYLDAAMTSISQARHIPRDSLSQINSRKKHRLYNQPCTRDLVNTAKFYIDHNIVYGTEIITNAGARVSIADYKILPGTRSEIIFTQNTPAVGSVLYADYDVAKNYYPTDINDALHIIPSTQQFPWDNAQIFFRNAPINAVHSNNIIYGWTNVGELGAYSRFIISKSSPYAPDIMLQNNGALIPANISNPVTGLITMNGASTSSHTLVLVASFSQILSGMIMNSDSSENDSISAFGAYVNNFPGDPKLVLSHCGHEILHSVTPEINKKYMFSFILDDDAKITHIGFNGSIIFSAANLLGSFDLSTLSEIYLKNELNPTIYLFGYWNRAMSAEDIADIYAAVVNNQLV